MPSIVALRQSLERASSDANAWFSSAAVSKGRNDFFAKGKLGDNGTGAVYAYFDANGEALYVGEASRPIKHRMHDEKSPHKNTVWWESWETVRFVQVQDRTDRLALELLLILALQPPFNSKPGVRGVGAMFPE
jgi:hypothetical protein